MKKCFVVFVFLFISCGEEEETTPTFSMFVATEATQPTCDGDRNGQLIYVEDVEKFKHCDSTSWIEIDSLNSAKMTSNWRYTNTSEYNYRTNDLRCFSNITNCSLNTVDLAIFSDGSSYLSASIVGGEIRSFGSCSMFIKPVSSEVTKTCLIGTLPTTVTFVLNPSTTPPTISVGVNEIFPFTLSEVVN